MAAISLISLPKELLRQICGNLPCQSALEFLLVCRHIHQVCDDWFVWREVARRYVANHIPDLGRKDTWKRYVVAAVKAREAEGFWMEKDLREYLPQLAALTYPDALRVPISFLSRFYHFLPSEVKLVHAAAFNLTVHHLSLSDSEWYSDKPLQLADESEFDMSLGLDGIDESTLEERGLLALQHAWMITVVGFICVKIRASRASFASASTAEFQCAHGEPTQIPTFILEPPSAIRIPFSRLMNLPQPFSPNSLEAFQTCHLPAMTDPQFFLSGEWIGYFAFSSSRNTLVSVGGRHHFDAFEKLEVLASRHGPFPDGQPSENVVRFQSIIGEDDGAKYTLQSNDFHSTENVHSIRMTVDRTTGRISIHHWRKQIADSEPMDGWISPFGIVSIDGDRATWSWFWKTEWSIPRPCSCGRESATAVKSVTHGL